MKQPFAWGTATAAFQIEGGYREDGKGDSIWDVYTHALARMGRGAVGDVACDHYHRFREDIRLMAGMGVNAYRFSIAWSRVLPNGTGEVNEAGIRFYSDLIDEMRAYGIEPYVTLYHWDLPQALFERGGWVSDEMPDWFYRYARLIGERFGDRVKHFITINEPSNIIEGMTPGGSNAPARGYSMPERLNAIHNILLSHGMAVKALRETVDGAKIGIAPCSGVPCPPADDPVFIERARQSYFYMSPQDPKDSVTVWLDPIFFGDYPQEYYEVYGDQMPEIHPGDLELISQPIDFCFQNIYGGQRYRSDGNGGWTPDMDGITYNMLGWAVVPDALYWGSRFLYERYQKPVCIMENGYCSADTVERDGCVHDMARCRFLEDYLGALMRAKADGVDIRGYFYWTLMDNLEWELGFEPRFGLIHVDFETLIRTPKDSYFRYRDLIALYTAMDI